MICQSRCKSARYLISTDSIINNSSLLIQSESDDIIIYSGNYNILAFVNDDAINGTKSGITFSSADEWAQEYQSAAPQDHAHDDRRWGHSWVEKKMLKRPQ